MQPASASLQESHVRLASAQIVLASDSPIMELQCRSQACTCHMLWQNPQKSEAAPKSVLNILNLETSRTVPRAGRSWCKDNIGENSQQNQLA